MYMIPIYVGWNERRGDWTLDLWIKSPSLCHWAIHSTAYNEGMQNHRQDTRYLFSNSNTNLRLSLGPVEKEAYFS